MSAELVQVFVSGLVGGVGGALGQHVIQGLRANAQAVGTKVRARLPMGASVELPPGLYAQLAQQAAHVDDDALQDLWADLIARGLQSTVSDGELRWAMMELSTLTPEAALALALVVDGERAVFVDQDAPRPETSSIRRTFSHLLHRGLLTEGEQGSKLWANNRSGFFAGRESQRGNAKGGFFVVTLGSESMAERCEGNAEHYLLSWTGQELARVVGIKRLTDYGAWNDALTTQAAAREEAVLAYRSRLRSVR